MIQDGSAQENQEEEVARDIPCEFIVAPSGAAEHILGTIGIGGSGLNCSSVCADKPTARAG